VRLLDGMSLGLSGENTLFCYHAGGKVVLVTDTDDRRESW